MSMQWIERGILKMPFPKPASQLTAFAHSNLHAMVNYEQKDLQKKTVCLLNIDIKSKSSKQDVKCTSIPSFKFVPFNSILN